MTLGLSGTVGSALNTATQAGRLTASSSGKPDAGNYAGVTVSYGFDIRVRNHTQIDGGVLASTGPAENNRLDTGTLGWRDIRNRADYEVEHQSAGLSTGGSLGDNFLGNLASNTLAGLNGSGHADSTTHAANGLSPIFDKEKEQRRLEAAQLIAEIGTQAADIARTEGKIAGEKAKKDPAQLAKAREELAAEAAAKGEIFSGDSDAVEKRAYQNAQQKWGTGSAVQQGIQAVTAAVQGLAGGDIAAAIAGGAALYLAEVIHRQTTNADGSVNKTANLMAHAVLGAVVSLAQNSSALAGAAGGAAGEATGMIAQSLYGRDAAHLTEEEKQLVSTLGTLAAGLAGGVAGGDTSSAAAGAAAGKNAVENNALNDGWDGLLPKGLADYGQSQTSLGNVMFKSGASPDEVAAAFVKNAQGQTPEGQDPVKGLLSAWGNFFGVPLDVVLSNEQMTPQKAAEIISSGVPTSEAKLLQYVAAKAFFTVAKSTDLGLSASNQKYVDILSPEAKQHILFGDSPTSGGHLYPGNPGKTVYPKDWSADKVVHEIGDIATSPDTKWFAQTGTGGDYTAAGKPARWVAWEERVGVRIRVVYEPANGKIITAFPDDKAVPPALKPIKK